MLSFLLGLLRAIVEMLGYCLIGQAILFLLAGKGRGGNPIYQLLSLITRPPRNLCSRILPKASPSWLVGLLSFLILVVLWLFLSWMRKFL